MKPDSEIVFRRLRDILRKHAGQLAVKSDSPVEYCLEGTTGPETVRIWKGKMRAAKIPVAWVTIGKAYVSYHLMGIYGNAALTKKLSKNLRARMQGKSCFNFKNSDEELFGELESVTSESIAAFKKGGYISD
jgi:hypothetical protein